MKIDGVPYTTIWLDDADNLQIINQLLLPHDFEVVNLKTAQDVVLAIKNMQVRGAGLIGAAAGFGMYLAAKEAPLTSVADFNSSVRLWADSLLASRPTASNLAWAVNRLWKAILESDLEQKVSAAKATALAIALEDAKFCQQIGEHGKQLLLKLMLDKGVSSLNILTHCNAGWLAFVDYGTALSPIYALHDAGIPVHVWVDETRPRNQGAALTCFELVKHGVKHTLISDNTGGHLMQKGLVDAVIVGADRVASNGDVANKIGTYLKALAAGDNNIPFYVAFPSSTLDFTLPSGEVIPIEQRNAWEVQSISGVDAAGDLHTVRICPEETSAANWSFDVTPARLITALITERGIVEPQKLADLYPEACKLALPPQEGLIKYFAMQEYSCKQLTKGQDLNLEQLNFMRTKLQQGKFLGRNSEGVGYGNVSCRLLDQGFMISASNTGHISHLDLVQYTYVRDFDPRQNTVVTQGLWPASSEAMTHAAIYAANDRVHFIWHGHDPVLFQSLIQKNYPSTPIDIPYGTPELALAVQNLVRDKSGSFGFITLGHKDGIFVCGSSLTDMWDFWEQWRA